MKRFLLLATVAFAFSATPALAAPIPHNDDNPDNWGAVYNLDLCNGEPCEFSATSTNQVVEFGILEDPTGEPNLICESMTATYELVPQANVFDRTDLVTGSPYGCVSGLVMPACVYSPSGFTNGLADIELWLRMSSTNPPVSDTAYFAKANGDAVGNYVYQFGSYEFDDQTVIHPPTSQYATLNGTHDIDGAPVLVEHDRGATSCSYPEI